MEIITNDFDGDVSDEESDEIVSTVIGLSKKLIAERMAIEVFSQLKVFHETQPNFDMYFEIAQDELIFTKQEKKEIIELSKKYLDKYGIEVLSYRPFVCSFRNDK